MCPSRVKEPPPIRLAVRPSNAPNEPPADAYSETSSNPSTTWSSFPDLSEISIDTMRPPKSVIRTRMLSFESV